MVKSTIKLPTNALLDALNSRPKHVFISGASRGIGEATARMLGDKNFNLTLAARSYNRLLGVAMDVGTDKAHAVTMDLADEASIDAAVVAAESRFGPIDVMICNAGMHAETPLSDVTAEGRQRFRRVVDVNLIGTYFLAQLASQHMPSNGRILFIGSTLGRFGAPRTHAYTASKHALLGIARGMAHELSRRNIRVNVVNPGWVDTRMAREAMQQMATASGQSLQQVTAQQIGNQPVRRMIKPIEVAAYLEFLVGPGGDAITGQGIDISGGAVMV
ncbi:MAG: SDR family oxidoreductase [Myxococcales bacterium]|nr:SDR family oxidoreductase [Myxococcales bacterium]